VARRKASRSSGLSVAQLNRNLERESIAPVYLVVGEEDFLRRKAVAAIVATVAGDEEEDPGMALVRLDGAITTLAAVIDEARSLPLFLLAGAEGRPVRVVLVSPYEATADDADLLEEYLQDPVEATCIVFEARKLDARRATAKLLNKHATKVQCDPPDRESDVRRWIENSVSARGFEISRDAVTYLLEMIGLDLQQLNQELDKVELFAAGGKRLEARDLEQLLGRSREHSVFELTDALIESRAEDALRVLNRLLDDGEEPVRVLAMVSWVIRQLITARDLAGRGCPERELLKQLGGRWDQRRRVLEKAAPAELSGLEGLLIACSRSDSTVKMQRGAGSRGTLERLCRRVCAA